MNLNEVIESAKTSQSINYAQSILNKSQKTKNSFLQKDIGNKTGNQMQNSRFCANNKNLN